MSEVALGYDSFLSLRQRLSETIGQIVDAMTELGASERANRLSDARKNLETDAFRLMVVGEFKRGKSTMINSMLGKDILPAKVAPCTALITEIKYGEMPVAVLHYADKNQGAVTVAVEDIRKYVVIQDDDEEEVSSAINQSPYSRMEMFYPLTLCRNNVEIIDSPGLNEAKARTDVALDYLPNADALIMVLSCEQLLSDSEIKFINQHLSGRDLKHVFFLLNRYDAIADSPDDFEDIKSRAKKFLEPRVGSSKRIFFVSARMALAGRRENSAEKLQKSRLPAFETALEEFLVAERGKVKMITPLRTAESALREALLETIPRRENMLSQPIEKLRERYEQQRPRLFESERQQQRVLGLIDRRKSLLLVEANLAVEQLITHLDANIRKEAAAVDVTMWESMVRRSDVRKRIAERLETWMQKEIKDWEDRTLRARVDEQLSCLQEDLDDQLRVFLKDLRAIREALTPDVKIGADQRPDEDVSPLSRVLGAVGGFFIGGPGAAMEGGIHGIKGMVQNLGVHVVTMAGLIFLGFGAPFILAATAAVGAGKALFGARTSTDQERERLSSELMAKFRQDAPRIHAGIGERLEAIIDELRTRVNSAMTTMIDDVKGQIEAALREKEKGELAMRRELDRLNHCRSQLLGATKVLDEIRNQMERRS